MKRRNILLCILCMGSIGFAQSVHIKKQEKQNLQTTGFYPILDKSGTKLLYTQSDFSGLRMKDLVSGKDLQISSERGAGYNPVFDQKLNSVSFRKERQENGRRFKTMVEYELNTGTQKVILPESRDTKRLNHEMENRKKQFLKITAVSEDLELVLYTDGSRKVLKPFSDVPGYIWVSLSPQNNRILFTAPTKGTFICDLNGQIVASLGYLNAPVWYNDEWVVGMCDKDNGEEIISSSIMMVQVNGENRTVLTPATSKAMNPTVAPLVGKIAYNTLSGEIYIMDIEIK